MYFITAEQRQSNYSLDLYYKRLRANRKTREAGAGDKKGGRLAQ
jgi:hypothetical protein